MNIKKHHIFDKELNHIVGYEDIKQWTKDNIDLLPDYIFHAPASSSGKYHPNYALGDGGLNRHVKGAMGIAINLFNCSTLCGKFTNYDKACILSALNLHDGLKSGLEDSGHTEFSHPLLMVKFLKENYKKGVNQIDEETLNIICKMIACHMGEWNTSKYSPIVLPLPQTPQEKFVHLCDYLGSRKCLEFNFEV